MKREGEETQRKELEQGRGGCGMGEPGDRVSLCFRKRDGMGKQEKTHQNPFFNTSANSIPSHSRFGNVRKNAQRDNVSPINSYVSTSRGTFSPCFLCEECRENSAYRDVRSASSELKLDWSVWIGRDGCVRVVWRRVLIVSVSVSGSSEDRCVILMGLA